MGRTSALEAYPQSEFKDTRCAEREDAGANPYAIRVGMRDGRSVQRTLTAVQRSTQKVASAVEICEVEEIVDGHVRFDGELFAEGVFPGEFEIEDSQPIKIGLIRRGCCQRGQHSSERLQLGQRKQAV